MEGLRLATHLRHRIRLGPHQVTSPVLQTTFLMVTKRSDQAKRKCIRKAANEEWSIKVNKGGEKGEASRPQWIIGHRSIMKNHMQVDTKADNESFIKAHRLAFKKGKWDLAFPIWKKLADKGYVRSSFYAGVCYDDGLGTKRDSEKAFEYYLMAAKMGHPESLYNVYIMLRDGIGVKKDLVQAIKWLKLAVRQKDVEAIRDLGYSYHEGRGVKKNLSLAVQYYKIAAKKGDAKAQKNLSLCYENGEGVPVSERWAKYWRFNSKKNKSK